MDFKLTIATCPFCGCGCCGIRICEQKGVSAVQADALSELPHAFVLCDSCRATWAEPDLTICHQYLSAVAPHCPVCDADLLDPHSEDQLGGSWATIEQVHQLGWGYSLNVDGGDMGELAMDDLESLFQNQPFWNDELT